MYVTQSGSYYKIGKLVIIRFSLQISSKGGMDGNMAIGGLPYAANFGAVTVTNCGGLQLASGESVSVGAITGTWIQLNVSSVSSTSVMSVAKITDSFLTYASFGYYVTT